MKLAGGVGASLTMKSVKKIESNERGAMTGSISKDGFRVGFS